MVEIANVEKRRMGLVIEFKLEDTAKGGQIVTGVDTIKDFSGSDPLWASIVRGAYELLRLAQERAHASWPGTLGEQKIRALADFLSEASPQWGHELHTPGEPNVRLGLAWERLPEDEDKTDPGFKRLDVARAWAGGGGGNG